MANSVDTKPLPGVPTEHFEAIQEELENVNQVIETCNSLPHGRLQIADSDEGMRFTCDTMHEDVMRGRTSEYRAKYAKKPEGTRNALQAAKELAESSPNGGRITGVSLRQGSQGVEMSGTFEKPARKPARVFPNGRPG